jgi:hypothetical protein
MNQQVETVAQLFQRLEVSGIPYAVLRNYERLPDLQTDRGVNTDLDLVIANEQLPKFRQLAAELAQHMGWDYVTECDHFTQSPMPEHHIEVFRFYRFHPLEFIEVDLFHSYNVMGLPLMSEQQLLEGRVYDPERGLSRIDPLKENVYRLQQIANGHNPQKNQRYIERVRSQPPVFQAVVKRYLSWPGVLAFRSLLAGHMRAFRLSMRLAAMAFALRVFLRSPVRVAKMMLARRRENRRRYHTNPCGIVLPVFADAEGREKLAQAARKLKTLNIVDDCVTHFDRDVLEQGGVVIEWAQADEAHLRIQSTDDAAGIAEKIGRYLAARHKVLNA